MGLASADTSKVLVILSGDIVGYAGVYLFFFLIYFWLHWVFVAARGLCL